MIGVVVVLPARTSEAVAVHGVITVEICAGGAPALAAALCVAMVAR